MAPELRAQTEASGFAERAARARVKGQGPEEFPRVNRVGTAHARPSCEGRFSFNENLRIFIEGKETADC